MSSTSDHARSPLRGVRSARSTLAFSLIVPALLLALPAMAQSASSSLEEVRRSFTLGGKPIPPEIFRDMGDGDLADGTSILDSVDVKAAVGANLYYDDIRRNDGWVIQKKINKEVLNGWEETAYKFIGSTANNLVVVVASYNGGGSGTFHTLHVLDLVAAKAFDSEGHVYDRLNLMTLREVPLGDRWDGSVKIRGNTLEVTTTRKGPADENGVTSTLRIEAQRL